MGINLTEGVLIAGITFLFFGGKKMPELGRTFGLSIKSFKEGLKEETDTQSTKNKEDKAEKNINQPSKNFLQ